MNSKQSTVDRPVYLRLWQIIGGKRRGSTAPIIEVSRATLWRWVAEGKFPAPVKLSEGITAWRSSDVEAWMASKEAQ